MGRENRVWERDRANMRNKEKKEKLKKVWLLGEIKCNFTVNLL